MTHPLDQPVADLTHTLERIGQAHDHAHNPIASTNASRIGANRNRGTRPPKRIDPQAFHRYRQALAQLPPLAAATRRIADLPTADPADTNHPPSAVHRRIRQLHDALADARRWHTTLTTDHADTVALISHHAAELRRHIDRCIGTTGTIYACPNPHNNPSCAGVRRRRAQSCTACYHHNYNRTKRARPTVRRRRSRGVYTTSTTQP